MNLKELYKEWFLEIFLAFKIFAGITLEFIADFGGLFLVLGSSIFIALYKNCLVGILLAFTVFILGMPLAIWWLITIPKKLNVRDEEC